MKKRIVSLLLALVMVLSLVPTTVWAAEDHDGQVRVIVENTTYAKAGKRPGASLKETGRKNPTRTALWAQECTEAALAAGTKVRHWGQSPEKVGCKRGAIGSTARGRRIARRRTFSAAGVIFVGRRQDPCAAGVSLFQGMYRRFLQRACICFSSAADTLR